MYFQIDLLNFWLNEDAKELEPKIYNFGHIEYLSWASQKVVSDKNVALCHTYKMSYHSFL